MNTVTVIVILLVLWYMYKSNCNEGMLTDFNYMRDDYMVSQMPLDVATTDEVDWDAEAPLDPIAIDPRYGRMLQMGPMGVPVDSSVNSGMFGKWSHTFAPANF